MADGGQDFDLGLVVGSAGEKGDDGSTVWNTSTAPTYSNSKYTFNISNLSGKTGLQIAVNDIIFYSTYYYIVSAVNTTTVDCSTRVSIKGSDASVTIVSSWSATTSDSKVPSEKLTKDTLDTKIAKSSTTGLVKNDGSIDTNTYLTSSAISGMLTTSDIANNLTTTTTGKVLDASQGKALADLIGDAITYINQQVVIKITNDTTTLNGALSELGETLATNITAKGVSASASDGLTTLANKVLQITGGGGSTTIFEDTCSTDNTSQYTNFYEIWDSKTTVNTSLSFDTDHYVLTNSNASFSSVCLPVTAGLDDWVLTAKIRAVSSSLNKGGGVGVATQTDKGIAIYQPNSTSTNHFILNNYAGSIASNTSVSNLSASDYNTYELTKDGTYLSFKVYNSSNTEVFTKDITITESTYYPNCLPCISIAKSDSIYVKEIKLESLGGGSDCSQYQTEINNASEYINGDGS